MCFIAFILKTTGSCKFFLYLQDPVITEPCIFIALGSGITKGVTTLAPWNKKSESFVTC